MGWNSYDAWGGSVDEATVLANAQFMHDHLAAHGWQYVVVDFRWYDAVSSYDDRNLTRERTGASEWLRWKRRCKRPPGWPTSWTVC